MDIFDVLKAISNRKVDLIENGMNEKVALKNARLNISSDYHIPLCDIIKLYNS
jgi:hypothetical protein